MAIPLQAFAIALFFLPAPLPPTPPEAPDPPEKVVVIDDGDMVVGDDDVVVRVDGRGGYIGVRLIPITSELRAHMGAPKDAGVLVGQVEADGAAAKAGVQVGDVITSVDGERVESAYDVSRAIRRKNAGETVKLDLVRDRSTKHLTLTVSERKGRDVRVRDFSRHLRDGILSDFELRGPMFESRRERLESRMEELEKRLGELEKKLAR